MGLGLDEESAILAGPNLRLSFVVSENAFILLSFLKNILLAARLTVLFCFAP